MEYTLVSQINPTRHNWTIKVRVARMWKLSSTSKWKGVTAMEFVLVDEEGVGITACIGHKDLNRFVGSLVEGSSYMIKKFQVSRQARKYGPVPNPQTIYFTPWTVVEEIPTEMATQLPLYVFNFVDFEELTHRRGSGHGLVDVIGQLAVIHPVLRSSGLNGVCVWRVVELRDLSDHLLQITLWGEHATSFEDQVLIETIDKDEPVVMVFAGVQVKQYLGATTCASGDGTKWYMNIDLPEVNAFRVSLQGRGSEVVFLPGDDDADAGVVDEAGANGKTVAELLALDPHDSNAVCFTCSAVVREIDISNGWWYKGCNTCKRGLKATFDGFECTNCDEAKPVVVPSYKLSVIIEDTIGCVKIFLFGGVAKQVVWWTAAELVEESPSNQILLPAPHRGLIGRKYVFQVVISEQTFRTG
ncbi:replication protein A 70 kDa DNA-binding subunit D-like [Miscanthus floridulus]|uniref:replication protein A 70 kDa DNA-binding subunit D-like n=1 Tax=Miscanthus floridulus TaxID=154761 RepID=UPI0034580F86